MRITNLTAGSRIYTCNAYLLTGDWNRLEDANTLIDVGRDRSIIERIHSASTGIGKKKVEQLIITHNHYDHASLLNDIKTLFHPQVYAYSSSLVGVDWYLKGGEQLHVADRMAEIIHTPGHSNDSICLYCEEEGILFAGDTPVCIRFPGGTYEESFVEVLAGLCHRKVQTIYLGHGRPITEGCQNLLRNSLKNICLSTITCNQ